jgi:hypothetical protein
MKNEALKMMLRILISSCPVIRWRDRVETSMTIAAC